jgi:hypothetical protein
MGSNLICFGQPVRAAGSAEPSADELALTAPSFDADGAAAAVSDGELGIESFG